MRAHLHLCARLSNAVSGVASTSTSFEKIQRWPAWRRRSSSRFNTSGGSGAARPRRRVQGGSTCGRERGGYSERNSTRPRQHRMQGKAPGAPRNRLADETSPYLVQHAANPVDWYPWGEARGRARARARPADPALDRLLGLPLVPRDGARVASRTRRLRAVMNRHFVNVKVDREERPDLDKVYQLAHQVLTQRAAAGRSRCSSRRTTSRRSSAAPIFRCAALRHAGVRRISSARCRLLPRRARRRRLAERGSCAASSPDLQRRPQPMRRRRCTRAPLDKARANLAASFDPRFGGFGPAPQVPACRFDRAVCCAPRVIQSAVHWRC